MITISQEELDRGAKEVVEGLKRLLAQQAQGMTGPGPISPAPQAKPVLWQRWQADVDRWVPLDHLPPGFVADPPPWTPLEGEILQTPAFALGDYAATAGAQEKIDVVIPYRLENDGEELRYAIRSIEKFFTPLGRIWVVGDKPSWLRPDGERLIHLNVGPICRIADVDIWHKLLAACLHEQPRLTERFVFWSDDQIALRPVGWEQLGPYHFGDLAALNPWPTGGPYHQWWQRLRHTMEFLRRAGKPTLHGDTHTPLPMERDGVVRLLQSVPWKQAPGLCVGTLWLNWHPGWAERSKPLGEQKINITQPLSTEELRRKLAGRWFLCHTPEGWTEELTKLLEQILKTSQLTYRSQKLRIGIVTPTLLIGGAERWVIDMATILKKSTFNYVGIALERAEGHSQFLQEAISQGTVVSGKIGIQSLIKRSDIVIYWNDIFLPNGKKGIFVGHSEHPWTRKKAEEAIRKGHWLVAVSQKVRSVFPFPELGTVLHHGINLERLKPTVSKEKIRSLWGIKEGEIVIGYLGRIAAEKNLSLIAQAAAKLGPQFRPVFCGPNYNKQLAQSLLKQCPWGIISEPITPIGNALQCFDCLVLVSSSEGFSYALVEGWGIGIPVVSTSVGIRPEIEEKYGPVGYSLAPSFSPSDLAEAIERSLQNNVEYIMKAQDIVLSHFTLNHMYTRWVAYLNHIQNNSTSQNFSLPMPLISILTGVYNTPARFLLDLWTAIQKQTWENWEWILIDDGSTSSETKNVLATISADPRVKLHCLSQNQGLANALNFGLRQCRGEWVARIDADDIPLPHWLSRMAAYLESHPEVDIVGCQLESFEDSTGRVLYRTSHPHIVTLTEFKKREDCWVVNHPGVLYKREAILRIGYRNLRYAEDLDLWIRALNKGLNIRNVPDILIRYRIHPKQKSQTKEWLITSQNLRKAILGEAAQEIHV